MRRSSWITVGLGVLGLLTLASSEAAAQAARVIVTVKDAAGQPIEGVTVTVTCAAKGDFQLVRITNAKGTANVTHLDSQQVYTYQIEKEGYEPQSREVRPDYTETTRLEVVLLPRVLAAAPAVAAPAPSGRGRALTAFNEGSEAQQRGDLVEAERKFRQAAELSPEAAEPHIALSIVAHQRSDYAAAAAEAEVAVAISPTNAQALFLSYDAYRLLGEADKAAAAADALRQTGNASLAAERVFSEGVAAHRRGETQLAVEKFRQSIDLDSKFVNGYLMLGNISLKQGDAAQAVALSAKALEIEPNNTNALKVHYDALRHLGDDAGASQALDALIAGDPEWASTELYNHAVELFNANEMTGAAAALERVVEAKPDDARAHFLLGMAKYNIGEADDARTHLTRFLELAPDDPDAAIAREMLSYAQP